MAISLNYRSFEEGPVGMDSIWMCFEYVLDRSEFQPFGGRNSLTDHKKASDILLMEKA